MRSLEKLADCLNAGLEVCGSGVVWESGGGGGRRREFWYPEAFVASIWLRIPEPSKGAPTNSSEDDSSRPRGCGFECRFTPFDPGGGGCSSFVARMGEGPPARRSSEELEELYAAKLGEVMVRTCPEAALLCERG